MQPEPPGSKLRALIEENGQLVYDPDKARELLNQACPSYPEEIQVLIDAQRASLPWELLNLGPQPDEKAVSQLISMLESKTGMPAEAAHWAVQTWAYALDINLGHLLDAAEGEPPAAEEHPTISETEPASAEARSISPSERFFVIDGPNRWGPGNVETLNQWAREGRLHGRMLFEEESTGRRHAANEVPGLFIPMAGPEQGAGAYYRPPSFSSEGAQVKRKTDAAMVKSVACTFCCCMIGGGIAFLIAVFAKLALAKGNLKSARQLAMWADIVFYSSIPLGIIGNIIELNYVMQHYPGLFK